MKTRRGWILGTVLALLSIACLWAGTPISTLDSVIQAVERGNYPEALRDSPPFRSHRSPARSGIAPATYMAMQPYD